MVEVRAKRASKPHPRNHRHYPPSCASGPGTRGRWSPDHRDLLLGADCDVWLLTEVSEKTVLPGYAIHCTSARMAARRHWAGVASRLPSAALPIRTRERGGAGRRVGVRELDPALEGLRLPRPWVGDRHVDKTTHAIDDLMLRLRTYPRLVWGGDWNHALTGREYAGSIGGRGPSPQLSTSSTWSSHHRPAAPDRGAAEHRPLAVLPRAVPRRRGSWRRPAASDSPTTTAYVVP